MEILSEKQKKNALIVDVKTENASRPVPSEAPQAADPKNEDPQKEIQEDPKASLLAYLQPPSLPEAILYVNKNQIAKAEEALSNFGFSFPLQGLLDSYKGMYECQQKTADILVKVAEQAGNANNFLNNVQKAQAEQQKVITERKVAEEQFLKTHPEYQAPQQATPQGKAAGFNVADILQNGMKLLNETATANPMTDQFNNYIAKKIEVELSQMLNPKPSAFEELGIQLVKEITSKRAAQIASS